MNDWRAFMAKYYPEGKLTDSFNVSGYAAAQTLVQVLKQCGDDLTRAATRLSRRLVGEGTRWSVCAAPPGQPRSKSELPEIFSGYGP